MNEQNLSQGDALDMLAKMDIAFSEQNLIYYAQEGDFNKTELLLVAGINPNKTWRNEKQKKNVYALHNTSGFGDPKMVQLLLEGGADVNLLDEKGISALIYAVEKNKTESVKILIDAGANVNLRTKDNLNPLYYAMKNKNGEIIDLLKSHGAEEMSAKEIKSYVRIQRASVIITIIVFGAIFWFIVRSCNNSSSSSSSDSTGTSTESSSESHTCGQCGNTFSGNGWQTVGGEQYQPTSWSGYGYCSKQCAFDSQPNKWK